jgi:hypothetical protein
LMPTNKDKFIDIPARTIRKHNVDKFWLNLDELTSEQTHPGTSG